LLLVAGVTGVRNSVNEWRDAVKPGQKLATASEMAHGLASWVTLVGLGMRKRWARPAAWAWTALITTTAGLATLYWGDAPLAAALPGAVATALLCGFAIRLAFEPVRRPADEGGT
jgi:hypothetical protein